jgi:monovalent cation:proton antiporter-2 (CPA2) family protein
MNEQTLLAETLILLTASAVAVPLFQYLRMGSILGFLVAGLVVGPSGMALITEVESVRHFAEWGVVFFLFLIGVDLKPSRLWLMRGMVFGAGLAQVVVTGLLITFLLQLFEIAMGPALLLGFGLALSSTAFVLQLLTERRELNTPHGRYAFGILLMQDLAVVPLLALIPLLATPDSSVGGNLGIALAEAAAIIAALILAGRFLMQPLLHQVARYGTAETFLATVLLLVVGTATLIGQFGMSTAMGAFLAGLLIADSEFRHQIMADIQPFRGILLGLFFMSVGMSVDLGQLLGQPLRFLLLVTALLALKGAVLWALGKAFRLSNVTAIRLGLLLAQGGEFGFVLFGVALQEGVLDPVLHDQAIMAIALSMVATPFLAARAGKVSDTVDEEAATLPPPTEGPKHLVIIAGFGRVGRRIANILEESGVSYIAMEQNPELVTTYRSDGYNVFFGDATRAEVLRAAGAAEARLMVVSLDREEAVEQLVGAVRTGFPDLPIYARGHDREACERLLELRVTGVVSETLESSLQLAKMALVGVGLTPADAEGKVDMVRRRDYGHLMEQATLPLPTGAASPEGAPAAGEHQRSAENA